MLATKKNNGEITTPAFAVNGNATLTFNAAAQEGDIVTLKKTIRFTTCRVGRSRLLARVYILSTERRLFSPMHADKGIFGLRSIYKKGCSGLLEQPFFDTINDYAMSI